MKTTFLVLSWIILPMVVLNSGILSLAGQDLPAPLSRGSAASIAGASNTLYENPPLAALAMTVVETNSRPVSTVLPTLNDFAASLKNGQAGQVTGVYVPGVLALPVTQQPANKPAYVNESLGYATQFSLAAEFGTTGLLAHNYRSGALFFNLSAGQEVDVIYGDGSIRRYSILVIRRFQALSPLDTGSNFVDLDDSSGAQISNSDLFYEIYAQGDRVVFQTCITAHGNASWGRLFVIATPLPLR